VCSKHPLGKPVALNAEVILDQILSWFPILVRDPDRDLQIL
jgi:hypothetical protein